MSSTLRIDEVERVEVGRFYWVPTVAYRFGSPRAALFNWPVIGPLHEDARWIGFPREHYHFDGRFLSQRQARFLVSVAFSAGDGIDEIVARWPLSQRVPDGEDLAAPRWRRLRCRRDTCWALPMEFTRVHAFPRLAEAFSGAPCGRSKGALVCPHKGARLTMPPDENGLIRCPLHGLLVDTKTERVVEYASEQA